MFRSSTLHSKNIVRNSDVTYAYSTTPKRITIVDNEIKLVHGAGLQNGTGFFDTITSIFSTVKDAAPHVVNALSGETATTISNTAHKVFNKNPEWRPGFPGEKHIPVQTPSGLTRGNFIGPGTNLDARIERGDMGVAPVDSISRTHDLRYSIAQNVRDIREADKKMVAAVDRVIDTKFNKLAAKRAIQAKMKLEDFGVNPSRFTSFGNVKDPAKIEKYKQLIQQSGFGIIQPTAASTSSVSTDILPRSKPPSHRLKMKLLANIRKTKVGAGRAKLSHGPSSSGRLRRT